EASLIGPGSALAREPAHVGDQLSDVAVGERRAERGHPGPADWRAAVLDEIEQVLIGAPVDRRGGTELTGPDQEEGGAPGALPVGPVAGCAETEVETCGRRRAGWWFGSIQEPRQPAREGSDRGDDHRESQQRSAH